MKLPGKVYLNKFMIRPGMLHPAEFPPDNPEEEYIHKDALLEWVKETEKSRMRVPVEAYNNEDYQAGFIDGFAKFRRILIERLESQ